MKLVCPKCKKEYNTDNYDVGRLNLRAEHSFTGGEDDGCCDVWFLCDNCNYAENLGCAIDPPSDIGKRVRKSREE